MSWVTAKEGIWHWLTSILATETIVWDKQNVGQPTKPYVTLATDSLVQVGDDYMGRANSLGVAHITGNRDFTLKIQYFGSGAEDKLENVRMATQNPLSLDTLRAYDVIFVSSEPVMDLTQLKQNGYEERAALDLHMRKDSTLSVTVGSIGSVAIQKRFEYEGLEYQSTGAIMIENITIP